MIFISVTRKISYFSILVFILSGNLFASFQTNLEKMESDRKNNIVNLASGIANKTKDIGNFLAATEKNLRKTGPTQKEKTLMFESLVTNGIVYGADAGSISDLYNIYALNAKGASENLTKHRLICFAASVAAALRYSGKTLTDIQLNKVFTGAASKYESLFKSYCTKVGALKEFNEAYTEKAESVKKAHKGMQDILVQEINDFKQDMQLKSTEAFNTQFKLPDIDEKARKLNNQINYINKLNALLSKKDRNDTEIIDLKGRLDQIRLINSKERDEVANQFNTLNVSTLSNLIAIDVLRVKVAADSGSFALNPQTNSDIYDEVYNRALRISAGKENDAEKLVGTYVSDLHVPNVKKGEVFRASDLLTTEQIKAKYNIYLEKSEVSSLKVDTIIDYFKHVFGAKITAVNHWGGETYTFNPRSTTDKDYLDPKYVVDYTNVQYDKSGNIISGSLNLETAMSHLRSLKYAVESSSTDYKSVRLRYAVKRALEFFKNNPTDIEFKKNILLALISVGGHCADGKDDGATFILGKLFKTAGDPLLKQPTLTMQGISDLVASQLRDDIFKQVINFSGETEPGATQAMYRRAFADSLKITSADAPAHDLNRGPAANLYSENETKLSDQTFYDRFYNGKQAASSGSDEAKRGHAGYKPSALMVEMFKALNTNAEYERIATKYLEDFINSNQLYMINNFLNKPSGTAGKTVAQKIYSTTMGFDDTAENSLNEIKMQYKAFTISILNEVFKNGANINGKQISCLNFQALRLILSMTGHLLK